jgi:hypothetical protein
MSNRKEVKLDQTSGDFKIREFEWFEVETKIRKFVSELM